MRAIVAVLAVLVAFTTSCGSQVPETSAMPNVVGSQLAKAKKMLEDIGLKVETTDVTGNNRSVFDADNWTVRSQSVKAGETVSKGGAVRLGIDKGDLDAPKASGGSGADDTAYAASIKQSILDGAQVSSTTDACSRGIEWICFISDISTSTNGVAIVTVQVTEDDKKLGESVARGVYNFASPTHPELWSVQVNNAAGQVLANKTFK